MTLPPANAMRPGQPQNFAIAPQVNGTLLFSWTEPVVKPVGTRYQLVRSTNSADASVGTVVWDGVDRLVPLVMPNSPHWYWVRGYAPENPTSYSPLNPNTFGLFGQARLEADDTLGRRISPDAEVERSTTNGEYWVSGYPAIFSLSPTGGVFAGRIIMTTTENLGSVPSVIFSLPNTPRPRWVNGQRVPFGIRIRRTSAASWSLVTTYVMFPRLYAWSGVGSPTAAEAGGSAFSFPNSQSAIRIFAASLALNAWTDFVANDAFVDVTGSNTPNVNSFFHLCVGLAMPGESKTGAYEIDFFGAT